MELHGKEVNYHIFVNVSTTILWACSFLHTDYRVIVLMNSPYSLTDNTNWIKVHVSFWSLDCRCLCHTIWVGLQSPFYGDRTVSISRTGICLVTFEWSIEPYWLLNNNYNLSCMLTDNITGINHKIRTMRIPINERCPDKKKHIVYCIIFLWV